MRWLRRNPRVGLLDLIEISIAIIYPLNKDGSSFLNDLNNNSHDFSRDSSNFILIQISFWWVIMWKSYKHYFFEIQILILFCYFKESKFASINSVSLSSCFLLSFLLILAILTAHIWHQLANKSSGGLRITVLMLQSTLA